MVRDQQGLPMAGSQASVAAFDRAVADYWGVTGDPVATLKGALGEEPDFALGAVAVAALFMVGGFRGDHPEAAEAIRAAEKAMAKASERERLHLAAVKAWAEGDLPGATRAWETVLIAWPRDALALRLAQDAYFFLGQPQALRDSIARALPAWDRDDPLRSFVLGAYAFGLEEMGELARAEDMARAALAGNPRDGWATHALAHVMETGSRQDEGIAFLKGTRAFWAPAHFMAGHNGWHLALFLIEIGRTDEVLADYDRFTAERLAQDLTLDRIDAASLLWRLELAGVEVGDRWAPVARGWMTHEGDHVLAFNDLHGAMAAARSPDAADAGRFQRSAEAFAREGRGHNARVTAEVGLSLFEGMLAFGRGDYAATVESILPIRYDAIRIGGSHAQRDVVSQTLIAAAERSGQGRLAEALLAERLAERPTPLTRAAYERARALAAE